MTKPSTDSVGGTMASPKQDPLGVAVGQHLAAVISIPLSGTLRHFKVRLASLDAESLWLDASPEQELLLNQIIDCKTTVGMAFRLEQTKFIFATIATEVRHPDTLRTDDMLRVRVQRPTSLKTVQRRIGYRVSVTPAADCTIQAWPITEEQRLDRKISSSLALPMEIRDISEGGFGFSVSPANGRPFEIKVNQRLRVAVKFESQETIFEGRVRHFKTLPNMQVHVGVQFVQNAASPATRQNMAFLSRVVTQLARHEARWKKLAG